MLVILILGLVALFVFRSLFGKTGEVVDDFDDGFSRTATDYYR